MSRPKNPDMIRTRLLDVGLAAFAKRGYHGTGIKEIVDTAQIPKGSFYNYFKSKEEFALAIVLRHSEEFWGKWRESFDSHQIDPLQALRDCFDTMLTEHLCCSVNTCSVVVHLAGEICENSETCRSTMSAVVQEWSENLAVVIRQAQKAKIIRQDLEAHQLATLFWDAWLGAMQRMKMNNSAEPLKQLVDLMFGTILKA
ncbi:TetR/AcrR family transcriptional regulator [Trichlorobacter lovleyi]|uniref:TetR/AcrR family transcriptional regulator n=1 Tax=Trichlorobacter lovleyi TaxID=313985 RepID=UPI0023F416ED|nr:TetR/AcrR family transcriptional regulator [Trichlorobacter lovleyi]